MLPQLHAARPRSDRHSTATLGWMSRPVAATPETMQQIVTTLIPDGSPDIQTVAAIARLSVRTLQRRLHDQGGDLRVGGRGGAPHHGAADAR